MKLFCKSLALVTGAFALSVAAGIAQDSGPLVDALVKKGLLTDQEAEEIRVDLIKENNLTSAGKLELSSFISHLRLYGDARLRYQYQNVHTSTDYATSSTEDRNRYRYRIRLGAEYIYNQNWSAGFRLETATANNSTNVDFGRYFDKFGDEVMVGLAYLEYQNQFSLFSQPGVASDGKNPGIPADPGVNTHLDIRLGKHEKQILLSEAWWDSDTNPEGVSEEVTFSNVGIDGLSLAARGGQFVLSAPNNSQAITTPHSNSTSALFLAQTEAKFAWASNSNIRLAPLYMTETPGAFTPANQEVNSANTIGIAPSTALIGTNPYFYTGRLEVVAVPVEVNWKMFNQPNRVWGTYGVNLEGNDRLRALGFPNTGGQNTFWNAGYQIGQNKVKGDWATSFEWRWIETASYTTNLSDSDWANNSLNQQGFVLRASYNIADPIVAQVSYYHSNPIEGGAKNINPASGAGGATYASGGGNPFAGQVDIVQLDLSWKF